jgi:hypothetical protein
LQALWPSRETSGGVNGVMPIVSPRVEARGTAAVMFLSNPESLVPGLTPMGGVGQNALTVILTVS